jgi:hypothetical protein
MIKILYITYSLIACCKIASSELFSIALVKRKELDNAEYMPLLKNGQYTRIPIEKNRILTLEDIKLVSLNPLSKSIVVQLNDEGARKIDKAVEAMDLSKDQLAFIVGNNLISTAFVHGKLGKTFEITGLEGVEDSKLQEVVNQINRRDYEVKADQDPPKKNISNNTQFASGFSEYGISVKEFQKKFGIPTKIAEGENEGDVVLQYQLDYPDLPPSCNETTMPRLGFAIFQNDKLVKITNDYSDEQKLKNPMISQPSTLKMNAPDLKTINKGIVEYLEKIKIHNINQKFNKRDIMDVLSLLAIAEQASSDKDKTDAMIRTDCDMVKFLSLHLFEEKNIAKFTQDGTIKYSDLNSLVQDYQRGKKPIP